MAHFYSAQNSYTFPYVIEGVAFDNDNSLYQEPDNARAVRRQGAVEAIQNQFPDMGDAEARKIMDYSKQKYGGSLEAFVTEHGADISMLRDDHYDYLIAHTSAQNGFFDMARTPQRQLEMLDQSGVKLAIATHGNRPWVHHTLIQNQLNEYFSDETVVTKDDAGGAGKNVSTAIYDLALDVLGAPETEYEAERGIGYAMVEDEMENLRLAKARGMATILINNGRYQPEEIADYVDVIVNDNKDATRLILESNSAQSNYDHDSIAPDTTPD
ncbi:MAG: HAD family hydrolase [Alcanivorax sp.]